MPKKILLLGGSEQQIIAITTANKLGYTTILCDYLSDNPGQKYADKFYLVSTTDKDAVLSVAEEEKIDGIVAYASDPAAPTAAYVAEKLGLQGIPYKTAQAFCEKNLFRAFLEKNDFNVPRSLTTTVEDFLPDLLNGFSFPVIVKPSDSSGSKGVSVVDSTLGIDGALREANQFSRNGNIIIEEFISRDHRHVIEAEIFIVDGEVAIWGLINSIRDEKSNPLVPAAYSYPLDLSKDREALVKKEVSHLVKKANIQNGAMNIEMIIDEHDRLFFLDVGPRNGGNMLPDFISKIFGVDLIAATIKVAMGESVVLGKNSDLQGYGYWGLGVLHSTRKGFFHNIVYTPEAQRSLIKDFIQVKPHDEVSSFMKCTDLLGLAFFRFDSRSQMDEVMNDFANSAYVELENKKQ